MNQTNDGFGIPEAAAIPVAGETPEQRIARLRARALEIAGQESDAELLAKFVAEEKARQREELLPQDTSGFPAEYDRVEIYEGADVNDLQYVPLGVNGLTIKVPRGEEVILPHVFVVGPLDHAVITTCTQGKDGLILRDKSRFPYQFKGKATKAEYQEYMAGQRAKAQMQLAAAA